MTISNTLNSINQVSKDLSRLEKNLADEYKKESNKTKRINDIHKTITKNTSTSMVRSKLNQIQRHQNELVKISEKKADISRKISEQKIKLNNYSQKLQKEQTAISKKQQREQKKIHNSYEERINQLSEGIKNDISINIDTVHQNTLEHLTKGEKYDVFISHASEDKEGFVNELVETLRNDYNISVWYDAISIKWGESLRVSIDNGLKTSKFGIVIISKSFISKGWTNYELDGLFQNEMAGGKTILPIWHNITKDEVHNFSPSIAGRHALNTSMFTIKEICENLKQILKES